MEEELQALREALEGAEMDLILYKKFAAGGNQYVQANYRHKLEQVERLRARIKELEEKETGVKKCPD